MKTQKAFELVVITKYGDTFDAQVTRWNQVGLSYDEATKSWRLLISDPVHDPVNMATRLAEALAAAQEFGASAKVNFVDVPILEPVIPHAMEVD